MENPNDKAAFVSLANKAIDKGFPIERAQELFKAQYSWAEKHLCLRHEMWTPPSQEPTLKSRASR